MTKQLWLLIILSKQNYIPFFYLMFKSLTTDNAVSWWSCDLFFLIFKSTTGNSMSWWSQSYDLFSLIFKSLTTGNSISWWGYDLFSLIFRSLTTVNSMSWWSCDLFSLIKSFTTDDSMSGWSYDHTNYTVNWALDWTPSLIDFMVLCIVSRSSFSFVGSCYWSLFINAF